MPELPEGHFFRIDTLLGIPNLQIRKKVFFGWFSVNEIGIWLYEGTDEEIFESAIFLKEMAFDETVSAKDILKANDRFGDYPPKTLGD